jgi:4,4'-diaponeurosporenoate glycosyltransferase
VRSSVIEDVALAQRFRASGLGVWVAAGRDAISYRLYPNGLRELAAGWTRSFASGARTTPPARFVAVFAYVAGVGTAAQVPFRAIVAALAGDALPAALAWAAYGAFAVQLAVQLRPLGNYSWAAPLFPIPLVAWFVIFARSIGALALGRVRWKGRSVPVGRRAAT